MYCIEDASLDQGIQDHWHSFDYLGEDSERALMNRANAVLNNSRIIQDIKIIILLNIFILICLVDRLCE